MKRLLVPSAALLWGLQIAFLSPALALILVTLYDASTAQVGWILMVYNASGFVASLLVPSYADRREDYLRPMLVCGVLTLVLALVLAFTTSLPVAVVALVVVGGPAGVGSSMLYAHLRHSGAKPADIVNTRAIVSVAWIAGPPLATLIIGAFGNRAILLAIGAVAVLVIATTVVMGERVNEELDHRHRPLRIPDGGGLGHFTACLGGIGRGDKDRHTVLLAESLSEANVVDVSVRKQQRPDVGQGSSHGLQLAKQVFPMAAQTGIDDRDRASVLNDIAIDQAR